MVKNLKNATQQFCDNCSDTMIFELQDNEGKVLHLGVTTVLECLAVAIAQGDLPKLPSSWLGDVRSLHNVDFPYGTWYNDKTV